MSVNGMPLHHLPGRCRLRLHNHGQRPVRAVRVAVSHPAFFAPDPAAPAAQAGPATTGGAAEAAEHRRGASAWVAMEANSGGDVAVLWDGGVVFDAAAGSSSGAQDAWEEGCGRPLGSPIESGATRDMEFVCCALSVGRHCLRILVHYHGDGDATLAYPEPTSEAGAGDGGQAGGPSRTATVRVAHVGRLAAACHSMHVVPAVTAALDLRPALSLDSRRDLSKSCVGGGHTAYAGFDATLESGDCADKMTLVLSVDGRQAVRSLGVCRSIRISKVACLSPAWRIAAALCPDPLLLATPSDAGGGLDGPRARGRRVCAVLHLTRAVGGATVSAALGAAPSADCGMADGQGKDGRVENEGGDSDPAKETVLSWAECLAGRETREAAAEMGAAGAGAEASGIRVEWRRVRRADGVVAGLDKGDKREKSDGSNVCLGSLLGEGAFQGNGTTRTEPGHAGKVLVVWEWKKADGAVSEAPDGDDGSSGGGDEMEEGVVAVPLPDDTSRGFSVCSPVAVPDVSAPRTVGLGEPALLDRAAGGSGESADGVKSGRGAGEVGGGDHGAAGAPDSGLADATSGGLGGIQVALLEAGAGGGLSRSAAVHAMDGGLGVVVLQVRVRNGGRAARVRIVADGGDDVDAGAALGPRADVPGGDAGETWRQRACVCAWGGALGGWMRLMPGEVRSVRVILNVGPGGGEYALPALALLVKHDVAAGEGGPDGVVERVWVSHPVLAPRLVYVQ